MYKWMKNKKANDRELLDKALEVLGQLTMYHDLPCIELGKSDARFCDKYCIGAGPKRLCWIRYLEKRVSHDKPGNISRRSKSEDS